MKKRCLVLSAFCSLLIAVFLCGCGGGGPGSPGSTGSEDTGIVLSAIITPYYQKTDYLTKSVDVIHTTCVAKDGTLYAEYFADHVALVTITARLLNPNATYQPRNISIERYTVDFFRSPDSVSAPPIQSDFRYQTIVITPPTIKSKPEDPTPTATETKATVTLVDLIRKAQYLQDILSGRYTTNILNNYTAVYTFYGQNEFGKSVTFIVQTDFQIGSFDYCGITEPPQ